MVAVALVAAWAMWQPLRSQDTGEHALVLVDNGRFSQAREQARRAHDINPLAIEPLVELATVEEATGRPVQARRALVDAVELQPSNPDAWKRLAELELRVFAPGGGAAGGAGGALPRPAIASDAAPGALRLPRDPAGRDRAGAVPRRDDAVAAPRTAGDAVPLSTQRCSRATNGVSSSRATANPTSDTGCGRAAR